MILAEYIARDRNVPWEVFRHHGRQDWVSDQDVMVANLGRTMKIGPQPHYMCWWRIKSIARMDEWEDYFRTAEGRHYAATSPVPAVDARIEDLQGSAVWRVRLEPPRGQRRLSAAANRPLRWPVQRARETGAEGGRRRRQPARRQPAPGSGDLELELDRREAKGLGQGACRAPVAGGPVAEYPAGIIPRVRAVVRHRAGVWVHRVTSGNVHVPNFRATQRCAGPGVFHGRRCLDCAPHPGLITTR